MSATCSAILRDYGDDIRNIVDVQEKENREAIFFIYEDNSTTEPFVGEPTSISLTKEEERMVQRRGSIKGSVHTHPTGFDPSTIDIVTGVSSGQDNMCIATPIDEPKTQGEFILTCLDFSSLGKVKRRQVFQSMRRSSVGITSIGRLIRKELNLNRFAIDQCRVEAK